MFLLDAHIRNADGFDQYLNGKAVAIEGYVVDNPLRTIFFIGLGFVVLILAVRKWVLSDLPDDRHYRDKGGRMD